MTYGSEPGLGAFQDRNAPLPKSPGLGRIDRRRQIAKHHQWLAGEAGHPERGVGIGVVGFLLGGEVDAEGDRPDRWVVGDSLQTFDENFLGVPSRAPGVDRVDGLETGVEDPRQPPRRPLPQRRQRDTDAIGGVDE